jgi:hypothetical protein
MRIDTLKCFGHINGEDRRRVGTIKCLLDGDNRALGFPKGV